MSRSGLPARVNRRTFLAGAAGGLVAVSLARCGGTGSRAQTTETVGGWLQPISRRSVGGQLSTTLRATEGPVLVGTKDARAVTYEQMYPAPTLEVRTGELLKVDLVNDTRQPTNLHTQRVARLAPSSL